jgi:hypothetical protein
MKAVNILESDNFIKGRQAGRQRFVALIIGRRLLYIST